jgi:polygalacturonase
LTSHLKNKTAFFSLAAILIFIASCSPKINNHAATGDGQKMSWQKIKVAAPFVMPDINIPIFPKRIFDITKYGAIEGGEIKNTDAIKKAISGCYNAGGGIVLVPAGKWLTGKVHLKSNVNLQIAEGAELLFNDDPQDYLPAVQSSWEGMECFNYSPLIYAFDCENVAITGKGTIKAKLDTWQVWYGRPPAHMEALKTLYNMAAKNVPVDERQMAVGENHFRPQFIQFNRCRNVLIENIKIRNSPFWTIHLLLCNGAVVRGVDVWAHGHNNDGIDPEMTKNLLIENCIFDQGDDAISVKSGRDQDGWRLNTSTENIVFRNCSIKDGHQLMAVGSELSGGIKNVYVHDCVIAATEKISLRYVLYIKTNQGRGGFVDSVFIENIKAAETTEGIFGLATDIYFQWKDLVPEYEQRLTPIKNIFLKNIEVGTVNTAIKLLGDIRLPVKNITLENITAHIVKDKKRVLENVENITELNVKLGD